MVPGGTNVIPGYDPATVRAMNLSRAENLLSQKQQYNHRQPEMIQSQQQSHSLEYLPNMQDSSCKGGDTTERFQQI